MNKNLVVIIIVILVLLLGWFLWSYFTEAGLESPAYKVIEQRGGYEIREYESYLVAEVEVDGEYQDALNKGFLILADYIFGNNKPSEKVAMTAPVTEEESEKIAMTAPVTSEETNNKSRIITFSMPSKYTLETLPEANNDKIIFKEVPAKKMAALRFGWYATESRVEAKKKELVEALERDNEKMISNLQVAYYNAPFTMPILLRNEILVEIR